MKIKQLVLFLLLGMLSPSIWGQNMQTADSAYTRPLFDVLLDIEKQFDIKIKVDKKMIAGKMLQYADWRIRPWSVHETLTGVLAPFDYVYVMDNEKYKIKQFEYPRGLPAMGKQFLDYLETQYSNLETWEPRRQELKNCLPQALRFSSLTERPNSKIILTKQRKYDGYTVENFALETLPGIYVCGSIYKPLKLKGKVPVMLNPNGHFGQGRYREDQQKRCAMQARMGMIAASWDLFAWGEGLLQFDGTLHRLSAAQSIQTLNTIRILDYLLTLPHADEQCVGITGGSGGGSMTMLVAAMDDRIALSIPTVMLASHFSGGCPCESGMPTHLCGNRTNNAEVAAMFAPKPQLILSDGKDWSHTVPELEFPFLQRTYRFYNAEAEVENVHFPDEGHDYGISKRKAMYRFVAKHFDLDLKKIEDKDGNIDESKVTIEEEHMMYTFGKEPKNLPPNMIKGKDALIKILKEEAIYE